jgi:FkbM family methyltransferase
MMQRLKSVGLHALRRVACLPLRALGTAQRGLALDELGASMVSEVEIPGGGRLRFMTPTPLLQARARSALSKETDTIEWIERFALNDVFWDVGANIGVFSLYAARRRGVSVLAFEPSAANYMVLCRNIQINALNDRIVPYCVALADDTVLGVLNLSSQEMGAALHQFGLRGNTSRYWSGGAGFCAQGMTGYTIDDFVRQFRPPFPAHLKIDVDGLEWPILEGAEQTLRDPRLRSIMAELSVSDRTELERSLAWLAAAGFELVSRGEIQVSAGHAAANHFFARPQR